MFQKKLTVVFLSFTSQCSTKSEFGFVKKKLADYKDDDQKEWISF